MFRNDSFNSEKKCTKAIYTACLTPGKPKTRKVYHFLLTLYCFSYDSKLFSTAKRSSLFTVQNLIILLGRKKVFYLKHREPTHFVGNFWGFPYQTEDLGQIHVRDYKKSSLHLFLYATPGSTTGPLNPPTCFDPLQQVIFFLISYSHPLSTRPH